jgi:trimeric autotransporter adhesin
MWLLTDASQELLYPWAGQTTIQFSPLTAPQVGTPMTVSAQVQPMLDGTTPPGGFIAFSAKTPGGVVPLGEAPVAPSGCAQVPLPQGVPFGTRALVASYTGDGTFSASQSEATVMVSPASTSVNLVGPTSLSAPGPLTLTAVVSGGGSLGNPTSGAVEFDDGGTPLGTVPLNAAGMATLGVPSLAIGSHGRTATYQPLSGSPYAAGQTGAPMTVQVVGNPPAPVSPSTDPVATTTTLAVEQVHARGPRRLCSARP